MKFVSVRDFQGLPTNAIGSEVDRQAGLILIWEVGDSKPETLAEWKAFARDKFYAIARNQIDQLTAKYSDTEQIGWPAKLAEARAYEASGNPATCPTLQAIVDLRPSATVASLVQTVLSKAAQLQTQVNLIDAKRGELCDLVDAAATIEAVKSITWELI